MKFRFIFKQVCIWIILIGLLPACTPHLSLYSNNFEYGYDVQNPLQLSYRTFFGSKPEEGIVFLKIETKKISKSASVKSLFEKYQLGYTVVSNYRQYLRDYSDTIEFNQVVKDPGDGSYIIRLFYNAAVSNEQFLALTITDKVTRRGQVYDINLNMNDESLFNKYGFFKMGYPFPITRNRCLAGDTVFVAPFSKSTDSLYVKYYKDNFPVALPAMAINATPSKPVLVEKRFKIGVRQLVVFNEPGLYFFQEDSATRKGVGLLVETEKFPLLTRSSELVQPLIYITTREERSRLNSAEKVKEILDQFWLEIGGNYDQARKLIKDYYEGVETANVHFSNFKEGWRTDRGMVMTVFGKPTKVFRDQQQEEWIYEKGPGQPDLNFVFVKRPTIFHPDNFELVRSAEYERLWYGTVEQWRRGVLRK